MASRPSCRAVRRCFTPVSSALWRCEMAMASVGLCVAAASAMRTAAGSSGAPSPPLLNALEPPPGKSAEEYAFPTGFQAELPET